MRRRWFLAVAAIGAVVPTVAFGQVGAPLAAPPPQTLALAEAIEYAAEHYPSVMAAIEQVNASTAGVSAARSAYLPRLDSVWQANRATVNNVFGQLLPQSVIPALSGPVLPATGRSVWGSAVGTLFSWEPFDFGLRAAAVASAESAVTRARANETLTRLDVQSAVASAYLRIVVLGRAVEAARADLDRRDVLARAARTLVDNQLRPGAEAARADAERAAAQTRLIQAQEARAVGEAALVRVLGLTTGRVAVESAGLSDRLPPSATVVPTAPDHPLVQVQQAAVDAARAQQQVLARTDLPHIYVQSSVSARGTGASADGQLDGGIDGLALDRVNWAAGVQVVFPNAFGYSSLRARKAVAAASFRAEQARYEEAQLTVRSQRDAAVAALEGARAVAANTPVQLAAAQQSEAQARARYQAGLASITEVADAQSLLAQADVQDQLARISVWQALLATAVADGNLSSFVTAVRASSGAP